MRARAIAERVKKQRMPARLKTQLNQPMKNHEMVTLQRDDQRLEELEKTIARGRRRLWRSDWPWPKSAT